MNRRSVVPAAAMLLTTVVCTSFIGLRVTEAQQPAASTSDKSATATQPATAAPATPVAADVTAPAKRVVDYDNPTLDDILDAWKERERKVTSFKFEWDTVRTVHEEFHPSANGTSSYRRLSPPMVYHQTGRTFALQGKKIAVAYPLGANTPEDKSDTLCWFRFNGTEMGRLWGLPKLSTRRDAAIKTLTEPPYFDEGFNTPFYYFFRPLFGITRDYVMLEDDKGPEKQVEITLVAPVDGNDKALRVQLERDRHRMIFTLRRVAGFPLESSTSLYMQEDFRGKLLGWKSSMKITVELEPHDVCRWIPRKWKTVHMKFSGEEINTEDESTVTSVSINEPLDESLFDPSNLPVGTIVTDEQSPGVELRYIIKEDGEQEPVIDPNQPAPRRKR